MVKLIFTPGTPNVESVASDPIKFSETVNVILKSLDTTIPKLNSRSIVSFVEVVHVLVPENVALFPLIAKSLKTNAVVRLCPTSSK